MRDPNPDVRFELAANRELLPAEVRRSLLSEVCDRRAVLRELAQNPAIPLDLLMELAPRARFAPGAELRVLAARGSPIIAPHPASGCAITTRRCRSASW